ncbi:uncharacterized protein FIBRA_03981 [Fibroporia radiculosa]|uniref:Uncharacterized protein n=1 Tax=Fibroporia radiculosa TaxID=599839 RepID=J4GNV0_9APHY|nr:uncharacterized protein FIBRA_03981 [Fibroporia radiculosa]CCM01910.1 predicted protein [Fibroporia radiculosa]
MATTAYNHVPHNQDYLRQPSSSPIMHRAAVPGGSATGAPAPFRAPAHKHAHHLHSIPPREKSTRTLIIDHLLWVHARTRFAQARAELGMTDRTGGPSSGNYIHRERPENYEEDEEIYSDGEDVRSLMARAGGPDHIHEDEDDERLEMQDLKLARSLRQRAEGVEKVATSMLDQPPSVLPMHPDDLSDSPTSPQLRPHNVQRDPHMLPNGVRLRLALATVINDLFSRRAPSPSSRQPAPPATSPSLPPLPLALVPLAAISSGTPQPIPTAQPASPVPRRPYPNQYIRSLYDIGAEADSANSPPSLRCPRHLHMGCEICVEAKATPPTRSGQTRTGQTRTGQTRSRSAQGRASSTTGSSPGDLPASGNNGACALVGGVTGWQDGSGIGSGLARPGARGTVLRRPSDAHPATHDANTVPQMCSTKLAELIVRFIRLSALVAMELGREATEDRASVDGGDARHEDSSPVAGPSAAPRPPASPQTSPRTLTHRNLAEAGLYYYALRPSREWYFLLAGLLTRAVVEGYMTAGWRGVGPLEILLGVGLDIAKVAASGRSNDRQRPNVGPSPGKSREDATVHEEEDEFKRFNPDDLPELDDATRILFPSLRDAFGASNTVYRQKEGAELEYEIEMMERLQRFYDVPPSTLDIATHMEDLQWQYPAEAVERAAIRFCEAIARWRGKPELETYKKATWIIGQREPRASAGAAMSIDALVHSNPTSPSNTTTPSEHHQPPQPQMAQDMKPHRPQIEKYFTIPQSVITQGRKRRRESDTERMDGARRISNPVYA